MTQRNWTGFPKFDSKNWTLFTKGLKELDPKRLFDSNNKTFLWLEELKFFVFESKKLSLYFQNYDSNYWTLFEQNLQNWTFLKYDSQNRTLFLKNMTHRNWTLLFNMSQRKWLHFWSWLKEFFLKKYLTQRTMILFLWK